MESFQTNQNYPKKLIRTGIEKAKQLKKKSGKDNKFSPWWSSKTLMTQSMTFLQHSKKMESILQSTRLIVSRRQPKNLKHILTKAEFSNSALWREK